MLYLVSELGGFRFHSELHPISGTQGLFCRAFFLIPRPCPKQWCQRIRENLKGKGLPNLIDIISKLSKQSNLDLRRPVFSRSCCGRPGEPLNKASERPKSVQVYGLIHVYTVGLEFQLSYSGRYKVSVLSTQLAPLTDTS